ncbi:UDP-N-acetylglucosamine 1-carboxyvinyltransferase [Chitinivibrio alkaliphilus]|uniref:UDP-N-acetylglucosamine 1-carboxyvinyltransferase n=1 Tax=Chitinivibrio alkaliphilus ACht1 TaxID=1313304 RepID=U7D4C3_9BACT|nr:UDP-N-acetylglucosamine 1-carboxyvinyltransferase [Chitinivibrio alkaliphilus]ERP31334.1 UDP-N-acetylglucosamine 1-carboxyvinyltransferase [Chitinivibrio alkaliphilus ACht1]
MSKFKVTGKKRLSGKLAISGNKNEALPLIAAALLTKKKTVLTNVPAIGDVEGMCAIATHLGALIETKDHTVTIHSDHIRTATLPLELSQKIRGSILFASTLLVRTGEAIIPQPGGDRIGRRRIDTHFLVFEKLGARISSQRKMTESGDECFTYILTAPQGLIGTDIYLDEASVTATENALIAASGAQGTTTITNAACEPHVQGLCRFLQKCGVKIEGIGSNILKIHGTESYDSVQHRLGCDYIEAGSFISLAACTNSDITLTNVDLSVMGLILYQFRRLGITVSTDCENGMIHIPDNQDMRIKNDLGGAIPRIADSPWPGFPADLTSIMLITATQAAGTCLIHEKMFESRLFFTDSLISMGAQIILCDPHRAVIVGPAKLSGASISSPDIRAGMALLIAALSAEGDSVIHNIEQIHRGYEDIDLRLNALGADIQR